MHEFQGNMKIFFKVTYYDQWVEIHESTMPLVHEITNLQILNTEAGQISIRPMEQLMYQFMAMPIPQSQGQYMEAYEFEDIIPQKHLLEAGEPGCSLPYPKVGNIMLVKDLQWQLGCDFQYGVVRHVQTKDASRDSDVSSFDTPEEQDCLVGHVKLSFILPSGRPSCKFMNLLETNYSCSWLKLMKLDSDFTAVKFHNGMPVEWQRM